jgi:hypothetical protein
MRETAYSILGISYTADAWTAWFTLAMVIVGIVTGAILVWQAVLIRRQVTLAREEFSASHKPQIILRDVSMVDEGGQKQVLFMMANVGDAEATVKHSWRLLEFVSVNGVVRPIRALGHNDLGEVKFQPGQYFDFLYPMTPQEISLLGRSSINVSAGLGPEFDCYFVGAIIYADKSGNLHTSAFRRKYQTKVFIRIADVDQEYTD